MKHYINIPQTQTEFNFLDEIVFLLMSLPVIKDTSMALYVEYNMSIFSTDIRIGYVVYLMVTVKKRKKCMSEMRLEEIGYFTAIFT